MNEFAQYDFFVVNKVPEICLMLNQINNQKSFFIIVIKFACRSEINIWKEMNTANSSTMQKSIKEKWACQF